MVGNFYSKDLSPFLRVNYKMKVKVIASSVKLEEEEVALLVEVLFSSSQDKRVGIHLIILENIIFTKVVRKSKHQKELTWSPKQFNE